MQGGAFMLEKPYCTVLSNQISTDFPELKALILQNQLRQATYKKGSVVPPVPKNQLMYLVCGSLKSYMCDENGDERLIYILLDDTIVFSAVDDYFLKTLVAQEPITAYYVDRASVFVFLQNDSEYIKKYCRIINARYGALLQQALSVNHCSAKYKVYSFLHQIAQKYGNTDSSGRIVIASFPTFTDIASITGVHRSNATSYINELKAQDVIARDKNCFVINDMALLEKIIDSLNACKN